MVFLSLLISSYSCEYKSCTYLSDAGEREMRKAVFSHMLRRGLVHQKDIADYEYIKNQDTIYVSNQYLTQFDLDGNYAIDSYRQMMEDDVPNVIGGIAFSLLSKNKLEEKAERKGAFMYITLGFRTTDGCNAIGFIESGKQLAPSNTLGSLIGGGYVCSFTFENDTLINKGCPVSGNS